MATAQLKCINNNTLKRELTVGKTYTLVVEYPIVSLSQIIDKQCILVDYGQPMLFSREQIINHFELNN